jgi:hypothetical protein
MSEFAEVDQRLPLQYPDGRWQNRYAAVGLLLRLGRAVNARW